MMSVLKTAKSSTKSSLGFSQQLYRGMTNQLRLLPDFLIIGGQRCGTSSLYYYLTEHPGILPAFTKEPHFFDEYFRKDRPGTGGSSQLPYKEVSANVFSERRC